MPDAAHDERLAAGFDKLAEDAPKIAAQLRAGDLDGTERTELAETLSVLAHGLLTIVAGPDALVHYFLVACSECDPRETMLWKTREERADWIAQHAQQTAHDQWATWQEFRTPTGDRPSPPGWR